MLRIVMLVTTLAWLAATASAPVAASAPATASASDTDSHPHHDNAANLLRLEIQLAAKAKGVYLSNIGTYVMGDPHDSCKLRNDVIKLPSDDDIRSMMLPAMRNMTQRKRDIMHAVINDENKSQQAGFKDVLTQLSHVVNGRSLAKLLGHHRYAQANITSPTRSKRAIGVGIDPFSWIWNAVQEVEIGVLRGQVNSMKKTNEMIVGRVNNLTAQAANTNKRIENIYEKLLILDDRTTANAFWIQTTSVLTREYAYLANELRAAVHSNRLSPILLTEDSLRRQLLRTNVNYNDLVLAAEPSLAYTLGRSIVLDVNVALGKIIHLVCMPQPTFHQLGTIASAKAPGDIVNHLYIRPLIPATVAVPRGSTSLLDIRYIPTGGCEERGGAIYICPRLLTSEQARTEPDEYKCLLQTFVAAASGTPSGRCQTEERVLADQEEFTRYITFNNSYIGVTTLNSFDVAELPGSGLHHVKSVQLTSRKFEVSAGTQQTIFFGKHVRLTGLSMNTTEHAYRPLTSSIELHDPLLLDQIKEAVLDQQQVELQQQANEMQQGMLAPVVAHEPNMVDMFHAHAPFTYPIAIAAAALLLLCLASCLVFCISGRFRQRVNNAGSRLRGAADFFGNSSSN